MKFAQWVLAFFATYAALATILVGLASQILSLSFQSLILPFMMLLGCGLLLSFLVYWVRQSYERPKTCALRFALVVFVYLQLFALVILLSASSIGILSRVTLLHDFIPLLAPGAAISASVAYVLTLKQLQAREKG
jgi:hypothetical protein